MPFFKSDGEEIKRKFISSKYPLRFHFFPFGAVRRAEAEIYWKSVSAPAASIFRAPADLHKSPDCILWGPDSDVNGIDDGDAAGEFFEVGAADEI